MKAMLKRVSKVHRDDAMNNEDQIKSSCRGKVSES